MASYTLRYPKLFWRLSVECCKFLLVNFVACNHFFLKKVYPKLGLSSMLTVTITWNILIQIYPTLFMLS